MPSLQPVLVGGRKYWRIVESVRVNGKPRPRPICYLGTTQNILKVFTDRKIEQSSKVPAPSRPDKTVQWLRHSRDNWKERCKKAKADLKVETLAVKRLRESYAKLKIAVKSYRMTIESLQNKLAAAEASVHQLTAALASRDEQIADLKKK